MGRLTSQPQVMTPARDRGSANALTGEIALPNSVQVADRFHLAHNVSDALQLLHRSRRWYYPVPEDTQEVWQKPARLPQPEPTPLKRARWEVVREQHHRGLAIRAIDRKLGRGHPSILRYLASDRTPECAPSRPQPTMLPPHLDYLRGR